MGPFILTFALLTVVSAMPDYGTLNDQYNYVDENIIDSELVPFPEIENEPQSVESLKIIGSIKDRVQAVIETIPDPIKLPNHVIHLDLGRGCSLTVSSRGIFVTGQNEVIIDTLRVNPLMPLLPRIRYTLIWPKVEFNVDMLNIILNINGTRFNGHMRGQITISDTELQGRAIYSVVFKRFYDLTANVKFGTFYSAVVSYLNGINTTSVFNAIVTDIIPQILVICSDLINTAVGAFILGWL